jgi:hypothetical protein
VANFFRGKNIEKLKHHVKTANDSIFASMTSFDFHGMYLKTSKRCSEANSKQSENWEFGN